MHTTRLLVQGNSFNKRLLGGGGGIPIVDVLQLSVALK